MYNKDFPLYYKFYQLTKIIYKMVRSFPKEHKFVLGTDVINLCWQCLDSAVSANAKTGAEKKKEILRLSESFEKLKMRIRMSLELNLISSSQFSHLQEQYLTEAGKMIGGWNKWA